MAPHSFAAHRWSGAAGLLLFWGNTSMLGDSRRCKSTRLGATRYATPGKAFLSFTFSFSLSSCDIDMDVSASRWAMELSNMSSKDRGPLLAFALASRAAAAFAPVASSMALCFAVACGVQPARQHEQRSAGAGAVLFKRTSFVAFIAAAFSSRNSLKSSVGSGVPSADTA